MPAAERNVDKLTPDTILLLMDEREKHARTVERYLHLLLQEREKRYEQRFESQQLEMQTADASVTARLVVMNEWRGTVTDIMSTLMPRKEAESQTLMLAAKIDTLNRSLTDKIDSLGNVSDRREGKSAGLHNVMGYVIGAAGVAAALAVLFTKGV